MKTTRKALGGTVASAALALLAALTAEPAQAVIGTLDRVPAATLLLPYFEVNRVDPDGAQTRFTVLNATQNPNVAHVVLWTDMGVPTFGFDLYIGGRDSVEVDLRLLFTLGILPQTSPSSFTAGPDSQPHNPVGTCSATATYAGFPVPDTLTGSQLSHIRLAHRGLPSPTFGNQCAGANKNDPVARGYVTIDVVHDCTSKFPSDSGYFAAGGTGIAKDANALFGTYTTINRNHVVSATSPLVAIEASATDPLTTSPGAYTFYAGYVNATAIDNREPLGSSAWRARTLDVGFFDAGTDLVVWRDPGFKHTPFTCGTPPADFPRQQSLIVAFDEQEHPTVLNAPPPPPNPPPPQVYPLPLVTQRVAASAMSPYLSGFIYLNLNSVVTGMPAALAGQSSSYVGVRHQLDGVFGAELPAVQDLDCAITCF